MWTGSVPWPYSTAGTLASRRIRRAAPLPNSVRDSACSLVSDMRVELLNVGSSVRVPAGEERASGLATASITESPHGSCGPVVSLAEATAQS